MDPTEAQQLPRFIDGIRGAFSLPNSSEAMVQLGIYLVIGGLLALYLRYIYRRFSQAGSYSDSVTRVFPLLTIVTVAVIAVVKSSLALSLGLVGALSIVRFRAAIKEPEELVYLFLCIAVGLCLGAGLLWFALLLVAAATFFAFTSYAMPFKHEHSQLLTITGNVQQNFTGSESDLFAALSENSRGFVIQRFDVE
ncbi:MAG: DUF4956 domain-containing protein, partial [Planctomycetales bacterium]|nr:DUF4956 domain-containing protein [Planctomycetales bacterium]